MMLKELRWECEVKRVEETNSEREAAKAAQWMTECEVQKVSEKDSEKISLTTSFENKKLRERRKRIVRVGEVQRVA